MADAMQVITIPQHDYGFNLAVTLQDHSGDIKVLSGYAAYLKVWEEGDPTVQRISSRTCTLVNAISGTITCAINSGDFTVAKAYAAEIEIRLSGDTARESFVPFMIDIAEGQ